jgi:hypothetical protein
MNNISRYITILSIVLLAVLTGCRQNTSASVDREESQEAKALLQGVWSNEDTEDVAFIMRGDSVYYPDSISMPAAFMVVGDTLYIGSSVRYHIEKHTEHVLWFRSNDGELVKLVKDADTADGQANFERKTPQILSLADVLKRDTVVTYEGNHYHLYVAINPTKYKVVRHTVNEDGLDVENVYYDNIIHLSIYQGAHSLFSRDFRKSFYQQRVPAAFFQQAVLNDMEYVGCDGQGFHLNVSVCMPGDASCYLIEHTVSFDGQLSTK